MIDRTKREAEWLPPRRLPPSRRWRDLWRSQLGKKYAMAASGAVLLAYVLIHLVGVLKLYAGPEAMNAYAAWLRSLGEPLLPHYGAVWAMRLLLLLSVGVHVVATVQLVALAKAARPHPYAVRVHRTVDLTSRTMRWGGVAIALFILFHVLHLTTGHLHPDFGSDVYRNIVLGLQQWPVALFYMGASVALGMHIYHGLWSAFQTFGSTHRGFHRGGRRLAAGVAVAVAGGNLSLPLGVLLGVIG